MAVSGGWWGSRELPSPTSLTAIPALSTPPYTVSNCFSFELKCQHFDVEANKNVLVGFIVVLIC